MEQPPNSDSGLGGPQYTRALLAAIVASSDDAIISKNLHGIISSWNQGAERLFGYTAAEVIGQPVLIIIPTERQAEEKMILERLAAGERTDHFETVRRAKDGRLIDVSLTVSPIRDEQGRIVGASKIARDISERKRIERERETLNRELERQVAERTAELQERARQLRVLARELTTAEQRERTRLAQMLHDDLAQVLAIARMQLGTLPAESAGVVGIVEGYLDKAIGYTRGMMNELSPRVLEDRGMAAALRWLAEEFHRRYHLHVDASDVDGECDLSPESCLLLFTGVRELLMNVVKHADTDRAAVRFTQDRRAARVAVRDWGKGYDPRRPRQTDSIVGGGFGLANLRERLEVLDGSMAVHTQPGQGTEVALELPLAASDAAAAARRPLAADPGAAEQPCPPRCIGVLLVDDHPIVRDGLRRVLESAGDIVVVAEASDGHEGLEQARVCSPDVVLMDVSMPRVNGMAATAALKREFPQTQVIMLSVYDDQESRTTARAAGAFAFLTKGCSTPHLISAIRSAFESRHDNVQA